MSEFEPTLEEFQADGYTLAQSAYLLMETALAKRILEDRKREGRWKGHEWGNLVQTSHEALWQAARREAGLPDTSAFKSKLLDVAPPEDAR